MNLLSLILAAIFLVQVSGIGDTAEDDYARVAELLQGVRTIELPEAYDELVSAYISAAEGFFATQTVIEGAARERLVSGASSYATLAGLQEEMSQWFDPGTVPTNLPASVEYGRRPNGGTPIGGDMAPTPTGFINPPLQPAPGRAPEGARETADGTNKVGVSPMTGLQEWEKTSTKILLSTDTALVPAPTNDKPIGGAAQTKVNIAVLTGVIVGALTIAFAAAF